MPRAGVGAPYPVFLAIGAFTLPLTSRLLTPRGALVVSSLLVALGYALWLPFHDSTTQALVNMAVAGLGSGALVAALPARGDGATATLTADRGLWAWRRGGRLGS